MSVDGPLVLEDIIASLRNKFELPVLRYRYSEHSDAKIQSFCDEAKRKLLNKHAQVSYDAQALQGVSCSPCTHKMYSREYTAGDKSNKDSVLPER